MSGVDSTENLKGDTYPVRSASRLGDSGAYLTQYSEALDHLEQQLRRQADDFRLLQSQYEELEVRFTHLRLSLAHRVGIAIVENARPLRWPRLPIALLQAARAYRADRQAGKFDAPHGQPDTLVGRSRPSQKPSRSHFDAAKAARLPRDFLLRARQLVDEIGLEEARQRIEAKYLELPRAFSLIEANYAFDDHTWLGCVNRYLERFDISPIQLEPGSSPRFHRISAPSVTRRNGPMVSVIVPAFNAEETIGHALESILKQSWESLEVIVVDDCSSDGTWEILRSIARRDDRLELIRNSRNVGPYVSKNRAVERARGHWITGHDADDWAHPQRIERQVQAMMRNPDCRASIGRMIRMDESGRFTHFSVTGKTSDDGVLRICSISCLIEREFFNRHLGHWDCVRFGADSEMIERCRKLLGDDFMIFSIMTMFCLDSEGSLTNHPLHGVSKETGISDSRRRYRDSWMAWHARMDPEDAHLDFPPDARKFYAPEDALVAPESIRKLLAS